MYVRTRNANREIPKLEIPGFSVFANTESRDFLKLVMGL